MDNSLIERRNRLDKNMAICLPSVIGEEHFCRHTASKMLSGVVDFPNCCTSQIFTTFCRKRVLQKSMAVQLQIEWCGVWLNRIKNDNEYTFLFNKKNLNGHCQNHYKLHYFYNFAKHIICWFGWLNIDWLVGGIGAGEIVVGVIEAGGIEAGSTCANVVAVGLGNAIGAVTGWLLWQ